MKILVKYMIGIIVFLFNLVVFGEIVLYLCMCFVYSVGVVFIFQSLVDMQDYVLVIGCYIWILMLSGQMVFLLFNKSGEINFVQIYIGLFQQLLVGVGGLLVMYCLLEVVLVYLEKLVIKFVDKIEWIKSLMNSSKEEMCELVVLFYFVVVLIVLGNELKLMIEQFIKIIKDNYSLEIQYGFLFVLGFMVGRYLVKKKMRMLE